MIPGLFEITLEIAGIHVDQVTPDHLLHFFILNPPLTALQKGMQQNRSHILVVEHDPSVGGPSHIMLQMEHRLDEAENGSILHGVSHGD
ncbi:MAG: hypothetical protein P8049_12530, partial [Gemmatimonadota bacterium]